MIDSQGKPSLNSTCPGSNPPPPPAIDAGPNVMDAGVVESDAGIGVDAGSPADAEPPPWPPINPDDNPQTAAPGIRLRAFLDGFPGRSVFQPLCAEDMSASLRAIARLAGTVATASSSCLLGRIPDPDLCRVFHATAPQTAAEVRTAVPKCSTTGGAAPCFTIDPDPTRCSHTDSSLSVAVRTSGSTPSDAHIVVECVVY